MQHTDLEVIKEIAIKFIYIKPEPKGQSNFCFHPYIGNSIILLPDTNEPSNIFQEIEKYRIWQEEFAEDIKQRKSAYSIACLVRTYYKPVFFEKNKDYLSEKDFAEILVDYWSASGITDVPKQNFYCGLKKQIKNI